MADPTADYPHPPRTAGRQTPHTEDILHRAVRAFCAAAAQLCTTIDRYAFFAYGVAAGLVFGEQFLPSTRAFLQNAADLSIEPRAVFGADVLGGHHEDGNVAPQRIGARGLGIFLHRGGIAPPVIAPCFWYDLYEACRSEAG